MGGEGRGGSSLRAKAGTGGFRSWRNRAVCGGPERLPVNGGGW